MVSPGGATKPVALKRPKSLATVTTADVPSMKTATFAVVDALEKVPAEHRDRVIRSARLILGEPSDG